MRGCHLQSAHLLVPSFPTSPKSGHCSDLLLFSLRSCGHALGWAATSPVLCGPTPEAASGPSPARRCPCVPRQVAASTLASRGPAPAPDCAPALSPLLETFPPPRPLALSPAEGHSFPCLPSPEHFPARGGRCVPLLCPFRSLCLPLVAPIRLNSLAGLYCLPRATKPNPVFSPPHSQPLTRARNISLVWVARP